MKEDGITNLIKLFGMWLAIWPRGGVQEPGVLSLSFSPGPDWNQVYAKIAMGVRWHNAAQPYYVGNKVLMGAALNVVIEEYNDKTVSHKPPVNLPCEVEMRLEEWCRERRFSWMTFCGHNESVICRAKFGGNVKKHAAGSFPEALALALGFDLAQIVGMKLGFCRVAGEDKR